jgi:hypothetical protein
VLSSCVKALIVKPSNGIIELLSLGQYNMGKLYFQPDLTEEVTGGIIGGARKRNYTEVKYYDYRVIINL